MKSASRFLVVSMAILSAAGLASDALARGGHRGGRMGGNTCLSGAMLDLSLANLDVMIKVDGRQKAALEELKKGAKEYSDNMAHVFTGDSPTDVPAKLAAADKRLDAALSGIRKLKPLAEKFYATLNDEQKARRTSLWIGLAYDIQFCSLIERYLRRQRI
jgi:LTXXQ motif family protein